MADYIESQQGADGDLIQGSPLDYQPGSAPAAPAEAAPASAPVAGETALIAALQGENAALRRVAMSQAPQPTQPLISEEEKREQLATRLLTEPDLVLGEVREQVKREMTVAYQQHQGVQKFQGDFWAKHADLAPHREMFDAMLLARASDYIKQGLSDAEAYEKHAGLVRREIAKIRGGSAPKAPLPAGSGETGVVFEETPAAPGAGSMSESLRRRHAAKHKASLTAGGMGMRYFDGRRAG